ARMLLHNLKKPLILLVLVVIGTVVGLFLPEIAWVRDGTVATWILYFLLFIIGIQMASGESDLSALMRQPSLLVVPLVTIAGTLLGSLGTLIFDGMTPGRALALGAGFGWYSLSGVLISNLGDPSLGAAAFLSNLLRETLAFLAIPLLRASGRCESGVGIAGATSMDVTLPVIEDAWGPGVIPLSVTHGVILSLLVPFLVPLFMSL
ncbi:MAG TPA: lysine exporter LysO family protein, partial [Treponemataceae bacterium]|nr:lysine exporter LysO family protein [Treponemataceae bacterium]